MTFPAISVYRWFALVFLLSSGLAEGLYVGTNYHPHDLKREDWRRDIPLMKEAGFKVVRMSHLAWESYEPAEDNFDFAWFDEVMDLMHQAGLKVILDFSVRPAPLWLHYKFPSTGITDTQGNVVYSSTRSMVDVGDPHYQEYALRYAYVLAEHYAKHPALLAFGIDYEAEDEPISYSETVRGRYIEWLKNKYKCLDNLNRAWSDRHGAAKVNDFNQIAFPESRGAAHPSEPVLDFHRFISHEVNQFLLQLIVQINSRAPGKLTTTNLGCDFPPKSSDFSEIVYTEQISRVGGAFYPGSSLLQQDGLDGALFALARIQFEGTKPFWCTEFTTGTAVPGSIRRSAYASLLLGNQLVCGSTWQTTQPEEQQYLEGLLDTDGQPNPKYDEYKKIAAEFKKIEPYGFPYQPRAEVGLAFSFSSQTVSPDRKDQHDDQLQTCFTALLTQNVDTRIVELTRSTLPYKLLIIPGLVSIDEETEAKIREFVHSGGTVLMTAPGVRPDALQEVNACRRLGKLSDVFGIRVAGSQETESLKALCARAHPQKALRLLYNGRELGLPRSRFDLIEPQHAEVLGKIFGLDHSYPLVTSNSYGAGTAIYLGVPAQSELIEVLAAELIEQLGISRGPTTPHGVMARYIDEKHVLYLNLEGRTKQVEFKGRGRSILFEKEYRDRFTLNPFEPEFVELE